MNGPSQQQVVWGNAQYTSVAPSAFNNTTRSDGKLWGANVRRIMGILQIVCGGFEFVLGIVVLIVPAYYYDYMDYAGGGIWSGLLTIVTGWLGVSSRRRKGMVVAYMTMSIIVAVLSVPCLFYAFFGTQSVTYRERLPNLPLYIILCIIFFAHMVISIIGASFTCGAVCSTTNQPQQIVYYTAQPLLQQFDPAPPYTVPASQSGPTFQTTTPDTHRVSVAQKI